jgi:hypothetical protein
MTAVAGVALIDIPETTESDREASANLREDRLTNARKGFELICINARDMKTLPNNLKP